MTEIDFFTREELELARKHANQPYDNSSPAYQAFYSIREKLKYFGERVGKSLQIPIKLCRLERLDKQAGQKAASNNFKDYILAGFCPEDLAMGKTLFVKFAVHLADGDGVLRLVVSLDIDYTSKKDQAPEVLREWVEKNKPKAVNIALMPPESLNWEVLVSKTLSEVREHFQAYIEAFEFFRDQGGNPEKPQFDRSAFDAKAIEVAKSERFLALMKESAYLFQEARKWVDALSAWWEDPDAVVIEAKEPPFQQQQQQFNPQSQFPEQGAFSKGAKIRPKQDLDLAEELLKVPPSELADDLNDWPGDFESFMESRAGRPEAELLNTLANIFAWITPYAFEFKSRNDSPLTLCPYPIDQKQWTQYILCYELGGDRDALQMGYRLGLKAFSDPTHTVPILARGHRQVLIDKGLVYNVQDAAFDISPDLLNWFSSIAGDPDMRWNTGFLCAHLLYQPELSELWLGKQYTPPGPKTIWVPLGKYDSETTQGEDKLGIMDDVRAFANLLAYKNLNPPLSLGLFGDWGSGKSFFMKKLEEEIGNKTALVANAEDPAWCKNILQIPFNAWHYMDTNLWASMVNHIFREIQQYLNPENRENELFAQLVSTQKLAEELTQDKKKVEEQKDKLEEELKKLNEQKIEAQKKLAEIKFQDVVESMKGAKVEFEGEEYDFAKAKEEASNAAKKIRDTAIAPKDSEEIAHFLKEYGSLKGQTSAAWEALLKVRSWKAVLVMLALLGIGIGGSFLLPSLLEWDGMKEFAAQALSVLGSIGAGLASIFSVVKPRLKEVKQGLGILSRTKEVMEDLERKAAPALRQKIAEQEEEYKALEEQQQELARRIVENNADLRATQEELKEIQKGKQIGSFIAKRLKSGDYQKHLGLISTIREDFHRLSDILVDKGEKEDKLDAEAQKIRDSLKQKDKKIDRIILYIDDLDRCPPDKVVDVLQAIHLMLAFPLFVVVVGVDVRWVSKSLLKRYGHLLNPEYGDQDEKIAEEMRGSATPYDYLEKIFQVPFRLKPLQLGAKRSFLGKLLENDLFVEVEDSEDDENTNHEDNREQNNGQDSQPETGEETAKPEAIFLTEIEPPQTKDNLQQAANLLKITPEEMKTIEALAPIMGDTPRTLKRFVNVYRFFKSNRKWFPEGETGPYREILTLLAIMMGCPNISQDFYEYLMGKKTNPLISNIVSEDFSLKKFISEWGDLEKILEQNGTRYQEAKALFQFFDQRKIGKIPNQGPEDEIMAIRDLGIYSKFWELAPAVTRFTFRIAD